uniref:Integrase catalytic domain-containing protein n=1 Tax=Sinocyclocheilus grahami TaxID=75366 RepID=A0A672SJQ7_SINGR
IPETVMSDNGPQYSCALFNNFASEYGFTHITSSPGYSQANGETECAVATVKGLWKGNKSFADIQVYTAGERLFPSSTPHGETTAFYSTTAPKFSNSSWQSIKGFRKTDKRTKERQQCWYVKHYRARPLPTLQPGQSVWLPREKSEGTVIRQAQTPRSYIVRTDEGLIRRNRIHMRAVHPPQYKKPNETTVTNPEQCDTGTHSTTDTKLSQNTDQSRAPYVTISGWVSQPPERLDL